MEYGLPRQKKYPMKNKRQTVTAIAYAKKEARRGNLTPNERDRILRKAHKLHPEIKISPTRGFRMRGV